MKHCRSSWIAVAVLALLTSCVSSPQKDSQSSVKEKIAELEFSSGGRIGLSAINLENDKRVQYRADERFPFCSTFKTIAVAAILKKSVTSSHLLKKRISYDSEDIKKSGWSPVTEKQLAKGMSIAEFCSATLQYSDNTAVNLLIKELGGLEAVNAFARSIGDDAFRLDRWEPELNEAEPGDLRDTTTPSAMEKSLQKLLLGDALPLPQREQLISWLKGNTTGNTRIRAGVPTGWVVGDKTGSGSYGTTNDIGVIWPANGAPIVLAIYFTQKSKDAESRSDLIASVTRILIDELR